MTQECVTARPLSPRKCFPMAANPRGADEERLLLLEPDSDLAAPPSTCSSSIVGSSSELRSTGQISTPLSMRSSEWSLSGLGNGDDERLAKQSEAHAHAVAIRTAVADVARMPQPGQAPGHSRAAPAASPVKREYEAISPSGAGKKQLDENRTPATDLAQSKKSGSSAPAADFGLSKVLQGRDSQQKCVPQSDPIIGMKVSETATNEPSTALSRTTSSLRKPYVSKTRARNSAVKKVADKKVADGSPERKKKTPAPVVAPAGSRHNSPDLVCQPSAIVCTASTASVAICHPAPDHHTRSAIFAGSIATLEATAERLSRTSSIEDAIRDEHNVLKRGDSRRSSMLQQQVQAAERSRALSPVSNSRPRLSMSVATLSRLGSFLGTNKAARLGGCSPAGCVMRPTSSFSTKSPRLWSASKVGSAAAASPVLARMSLDSSSDEEKHSKKGRRLLISWRSSTRSMRSIRSAMSANGKLSLAEIAEMEPPLSLTQEALDEADAGAGGDIWYDEDDSIRASAHQQVESAFAETMLEDEDAATPDAKTGQAVLHEHGHPYVVAQPGGSFAPWRPYGSTQLQQPWPTRARDQADGRNGPRPATWGSVNTVERACDAFLDFDGTHCDPESVQNDSPPHGPEPSLNEPAPAPVEQSSTSQVELAPNGASRRRLVPLGPRTARPTSYMDLFTSQQMLYYPVRVPSMLNLPPKLSKNSNEKAAGNQRQTRILSYIMAQEEEHRASQERASRSSFLPETSSLVEGSGKMEGFDVQASARTCHDTPAPPFQTDLGLGCPDGVFFESPLPNLPPQLGVSAFFELAPLSLRSPALALSQLEVEDGSATQTLDRILDASTDLPVNAFTDHGFAGKFDRDDYGPENTRSHLPESTRTAYNKSWRKEPEKLQKPNLAETLPAMRAIPALAPRTKKRSTFMSLFGSSGQNKYKKAEQEQPESPNALAPTEDESSDSDEYDEDASEEREVDEEDEMYSGAPTTLMAELQLRKQQQKMRLRSPALAYHDGMRSTLLELDAVNEQQRKARQSRRVNLSWQNTFAADHDGGGDEDEDVPLAFIAAKAAVANINGVNRSSMDLSALLGDVYRPLGLMQQRDLDDFESLSRRRDRLQGRNDPVNLEALQKQTSWMGLTQSTQGASKRTLQAPRQDRNGAVLSCDGDEEKTEPDVQGETLAARKARLAAGNPLPWTKPVSGTFSSELLSVFGGVETDGAARAESKAATSLLAESPKKSTPAMDSSAKVTLSPSSVSAGPDGAVRSVLPPRPDISPGPEKEETLGQRKRRLQAEQEARDCVMKAAIRPVNEDAGTDPHLSRKPSMAHVLMAHPIEAPQENEDLVQAREWQVQQQHEATLAALREQMPTQLTGTATDAARGGFAGGRFNGIAHGANESMTSLPGLQQRRHLSRITSLYNVGGVTQQSRLQRQLSMGFGAAQPDRPMIGAGNLHPNAMGLDRNGVCAGTVAAMGTPKFGVYGGGGGDCKPMSIYNMYNTANFGNMGTGFGGPQGPAAQAGHLDRVEKWRQGVMP